MTSQAPLTLVRLLQLASPALPIGAYSYSQGLEWAVTTGAVCDERSAAEWVGDVLELVIVPGEAAVLWRLLIAAQQGDGQRLHEWNEWFRASRETAELRAETEQMGVSLVGLAGELGLLDEARRAAAKAMVPVTLPAAYALASQGFGIPPDAALLAYLWAWLENQVLAAMKTVPLGQVAGQRTLAELGARIPRAAECAQSIHDNDLNTFAPGFAIASCLHEMQYSRLFRS
ncbi:MAG TPA: urease accessory protein UreF [Casimicrobiaceae bacterium]|nr:urease accessory protein UreF [Casimicrobiaceae bacterium]